jgi:TPR repeat protein
MPKLLPGIAKLRDKETRKLSTASPPYIATVKECRKIQLQLSTGAANPLIRVMREPQYALGYTYYVGKEVPQEYATAFGWYRKAAEQGYAEAQSDLGYMYAEGNGVPQDYTEAVRWYRRAADQGYAKGQDGLGYAYSHGKGVPQNYADAARWYRMAAKQGDEYAERALNSMNTRGHSGPRLITSKQEVPSNSLDLSPATGFVLASLSNRVMCPTKWELSALMRVSAS